jgi:hypothetical protein
LIDRDLWNKFNNPVSNDPIMSAQDGVLGSLISPTRLGRLQLASNRFGAEKAYNAMELLNDVQTGLFSELSSKKTIDQYRRLLQMSYVDKLVDILNPPSTAGSITITIGGRGGASLDINKSDVPAIVRAQLVALRAQINSSAPGFGDKLSKIHLLDLSEKIKQGLDPK